MHWDYCFIFEVSTKETLRPKPWLAEFAFVNQGSNPELGSAQDAIFDALKSR